MKEDKDTDRLLGRKLASYEAKPRKLTFDTLQKNYLVQKKISVTSGIITKAFVLVAVLGVSVGVWLFLPKNTSTPTASNKKAVNTDTTASASEIVAGSNELSYSSLSPLTNSSEINTIPADIKDVATPTLQNTTAPAVENKNNTSGFNITALTKENEYNNSKINSPERNSMKPGKPDTVTPSAVASLKAAGNDRTQSTEINATANKTSREQNQSTVPLSPKTKPASVKNTTSQDVPAKEPVARSTKNITTKTGTNTPANNQTPLGTEPAVTDHSQTKPIVADAIAGTPNIFEKEIPPTEPVTNSNSKTGETTTLSANTKKDTTEPEIKTAPLAAPGTKTLAAATASQAAESPSLTPPTHPKKHRLLFSTELLRNTTALKFNVPFSDTAHTSAAASQTTQTNHFFSGALLLGYKYKNAGFGTGIGFLSIENEVGTNGYAQKQKLYAMNIIQNSVTTTSITTTTTLIPSTDTLSPPIVITHTSITTYTVTDIDTTYTFSGTRDYIVVNGDTVSPQNYLHQIRFFTIPFQLNYSFNLLRNRLVVEPQAGIQLGVPVTSYQLVHERDGVFTYSKRKLPLKTTFVLFDANLKINYRLSRHALLYVKQGYSFSGKNIYRNSYPDKHKLANLYSAVGLSLVFD